MCVLMFKTPHRPDGKIADALALILAAQLRMTLRSTTGGACRRDLENSHRPDGKNADALASTLALHNWECFGQLQYVRAAETFKSSHRPDGKNADALALILACTTANASVNYSGYVPQRP